jgi:hypothetical protein
MAFRVILTSGKVKFKFEKKKFHNNSEVKFTFMRIVFRMGDLTGGLTYLGQWHRAHSYS